MIRKQVLSLHDLEYDTAYPYGQDYELWVRLLANTEAANLENQLLLYRAHDNSITSTKRNEQMTCHIRVMRCMFEKFLPGCAVSVDELKALQALLVQGGSRVVQRERLAFEWTLLYIRILESFVRTYKQKTGLTEVRRLAMHVLLTVFFRSGISFKGRMSLLGRFFRVDPLLPLTITRLILDAGMRRL